jgi:NAD(P)-dependent dehydrogenase (short-subunit alcohol dehydrogenase family)
MRPEEYSEAMDLDLKGKIALVTGSTAGIGFAIAKRFTVEGAEVILNGRTDERVRESIAKIENEVSGAKLRGVAADLGTAQGCDKIVREAQRIDILINNVGIFEPMPFERSPIKIGRNSSQ